MHELKEDRSHMSRRSGKCGLFRPVHQFPYSPNSQTASDYNLFYFVFTHFLSKLQVPLLPLVPKGKNCLFWVEYSTWEFFSLFQKKRTSHSTNVPDLIFILLSLDSKTRLLTETVLVSAIEIQIDSNRDFEKNLACKVSVFFSLQTKWSQRVTKSAKNNDSSRFSKSYFAEPLVLFLQTRSMSKARLSPIWNFLIIWIHELKKVILSR